MKELTAKERETYRSGIWLAGGPRCVLCGCSESNHDNYGCLVCTCPKFEVKR